MLPMPRLRLSHKSNFALFFRLFIIATQDCPKTDVDFRAQQCSEVREGFDVDVACFFPGVTRIILIQNPFLI